MNMFASTIYIKVSANHLHVRNLEANSGADARATIPFTTTRLLVGEFKIAEALLKDLLKRVGLGGSLRPAPIALIHPAEMVEGGLSEVEERLFLELAMGAGARRAVVYVGPDLGDDAVRVKVSPD